MQTEWIWEAKANQAILTEKRSQKVWLKQDLLNRKHVYAVFQRSRDIFFSLLAIIVLSPLMLLTALLIVLDDPHGSPIFSQYRVGKNGRKFKLYKFRSMVVHAEDNLESLMQQNEMDGPVFKIKKDPRITRIGHFIRKTSIDELPQLFNICKGDMSIVGPRPERPEIAAEYEKEMPEFRLRLQARAGLTGYAQVYGKYNTTPYDKLQMDLSYIASPSVWEDLRIMFATVKILFMPESTEGVAEGATTAMGVEEVAATKENKE